MKTVLVTLLCASTLSGGLFAQAPAAPAAPTAIAANPSVSPSASRESSIEQSIRKQHKRHFNFTVGKEDTDSGRTRHEADDDIPTMVVPIVGVVFLSIFGAPVLIVAVILYF